MSKFIVRRLLWLIPTLLGVAILIFTLMYVVPGDPAVMILGSQATEADYAAMRERLGLNDPYWVQLGNYLYNVFLKGDFGTSYTLNAPVVNELIKRIPRTAAIGFSCIIISFVISIPLGVSAAVHQGKWQDRFLMVVSLVGVSLPDFWFGLMFVLLFAVKLNLLPSVGVGGIEYYILPCITGSIGSIAGLARQTRSSMLEVIRSDYIVTARSKGISNTRVIWGHALPNALIPIITLLGSRFGTIIAGTVIIETLFSVPGVGLYMVNALNNRDYPVVRGCVIILAAFAALAQLLTDLAYAYVDPRIRAQFAGKAKRKRADEDK